METPWRLFSHQGLYAPQSAEHLSTSATKMWPHCGILCHKINLTFIPSSGHTNATAFRDRIIKSPLRN